MLHWAINDWKLPGKASWPANTNQAGLLYVTGVACNVCSMLDLSVRLAGRQVERGPISARWLNEDSSARRDYTCIVSIVDGHLGHRCFEMSCTRQAGLIEVAKVACDDMLSKYRVIGQLRSSQCR